MAGLCDSLYVPMKKKNLRIICCIFSSCSSDVTYREGKLRDKQISVDCCVESTENLRQFSLEIKG